MSHMTSTLGTKLLISAHEDNAVIASNDELAIQVLVPRKQRGRAEILSP